MRLDKAVTLAGLTRSEARKAILSGRATVSGAVVRKADTDVDPEDVCLDGEPVGSGGHIHIMLNKPAGVLTATSDSRDRTVIDLLPEKLARKKIGPVGRLDKDVTGLIILTTDGQLAHRLISPARGVKKVYVALVEGSPSENELDVIRRGGIVFSDFTSRPAQAVKTGENEITLTLTEGRFHEVKRVCARIGHEVVALRRVELSGVALDPARGEGHWRYLTGGEAESLYAAAGMNGNGE